MRRMELDLEERERLLYQRENAVAQQLRTIQEMEKQSRQQERENEKKKAKECSFVEQEPSLAQHDLLGLCSGSDLKQDATLATVPSSLAWDTLSQIEQQTNETLQVFRDECWTFSSLGAIFRVDSSTL